MIEQLITSEQIQGRIVELADRIKGDYEGQDLVLVGLLNGCVIFMSDLARSLYPAHIKLDFMGASSYGVGVSSSGNVQITKDLGLDIKGQNVLVVEDIIDTARTIAKVIDLLQFRQPKSLRICALLDKPERRIVPVELDYVGFKIPDRFVVGYGMDYNQQYRNLPFVGVLK